MKPRRPYTTPKLEHLTNRDERRLALRGATLAGARFITDDRARARVHDGAEPATPKS